MLTAAVHIELTAGVYGGLREGEGVAHLTTWQLQQMRRAARLRARLPWRDSIMEAERALHETAVELARRGAMPLRRRHVPSAGPSL